MSKKPVYELETYAAILVYVEEVITAYKGNTNNSVCDTLVDKCLTHLSPVWNLIRDNAGKTELDTKKVNERYSFFREQSNITKQDAVSYLAVTMCILDFLGKDSFTHRMWRHLGIVESNCQGINDFIESEITYDASWDKGRMLWVMFEQRINDWDKERRKLFLVKP